MTRLSDAQIEKLVKAGRIAAADLPAKEPKEPKYHNIPVVFDGIRFDSKAEARRYGQLKLMRAGGEIFGLHIHPGFVLRDAFTDAEGRKHRRIKYVADFWYFDAMTNKTVIEDVKGVETAAFKIKRALFEERFPRYELRVIPAKEV